MKYVIIIFCLTTFFLIGHYDNLYSEDHRSFYMGFTPHPYDYTAEAVNQTYSSIAEHSDIICHHFDDGIPWQEALDQTPYHPNVEGELKSRVNRLNKQQKVYVALAPLGYERYSLAGYWGENSGMHRTGKWKDKIFSDSEVITAYINFCRDLINRFQPDYFNYGVEVNVHWQSYDNPNFKKFLVFAEAVYTTLKKEFPSLPVFISLYKEKAESDQNEIQINNALLQYSDLIGVSTYPFIFFWNQPHTTDPSHLPKDWLKSMQELDPDKPLVIAETGYIAEDLIMDSIKLNLAGNHKWQSRYLEFLFTEMNKLNALFIIWFVYRDYDAAWQKLEQWGYPEWHRTWKDCGLVDEQGQKRSGFALWDQWYSRSLQN